MRKGIYLLGFFMLAFGACVDDKESSDVTELRGARLELTQAETAYFKSQTVLQEKEAQYKEALIDYQKALLAGELADNERAKAEWELKLANLQQEQAVEALRLEKLQEELKVELERAKKEAELAKNETLLAYLDAYNAAVNDAYYTQQSITNAYASIGHTEDNIEMSIKMQMEDIEFREKELAELQETLEFYTQLNDSGASATNDINARIDEHQALITAAKAKKVKLEAEKLETEKALIKMFPGLDLSRLNYYWSSTYPMESSVNYYDFISGRAFESGLIEQTDFMKNVQLYLKADQTFGYYNFRPEGSSVSKRLYFDDYNNTAALSDVDITSVNNVINQLTEYNKNYWTRELEESTKVAKAEEEKVTKLEGEKDSVSLVYAKARNERDIAKRSYDNLVATNASQTLIDNAEAEFNRRDSISTVEQSKYNSISAALSAAQLSLSNAEGAITYAENRLSRYDEDLALAKDFKAMIEAGTYVEMWTEIDSMRNATNEIYSKIYQQDQVISLNSSIISRLKSSLNNVDYTQAVNYYTESVASTQKLLDEAKEYLTKLESGESNYQDDINYQTARIEVLKVQLEAYQTEAARYKTLIDAY